MIQKRSKPDYTRTIRFKSFLMFLGKIYCEYFRYLICYYLADGSIEVREGIQLFIFKPFKGTVHVILIDLPHVKLTTTKFIPSVSEYLSHILISFKINLIYLNTQNI